MVQIRLQFSSTRSACDRLHKNISVFAFTRKLISDIVLLRIVC